MPGTVGPKTRLVMCFLLCLSCGCDEEKPYTPFEVATALPENAEGTGPAVGTPELLKRIEAPPVVALRAPENTTRWTAFGRKIEAAPATTLQVGIEIPGGRSKDIVVWLLPERGAPKAPDAGLWTVDEKGRLGSRLLKLPSFLARGSDCHYRASLLQSGATSLTARVRAQCRTRLMPGSPVESVAVLSPLEEEAVLLHLAIQESAPGESLKLKVDSSDRDQDGKDDIKIEFSLKNPQGQEERLPFVWLSRTAGASREAGSPKKELAKRVSRLKIASVRKAERGTVSAEVNSLRRLISSICSRSATQRVSHASGSGLRCGEIGKSLSSLTHSVVQAHLGQGEFGLALGEATRSGWFLSEAPQAEQQSLGTLLKKKLPHHEVKRLARFKVKLQSLPGPHSSPLRFDKNGQLWALAKAGPTKRLTMKGDPPLVTPASEDAPEKKIEPPSWTLSPAGPEGRTLSAALPSCDRSEVQLAFSISPGATPPPPVPLPILSPRPGACKTLATIALGEVPLFWQGNQLLLILGGQLIASGGSPRPLKTAIAWGTPFGVALQTGESLQLLTGKVAQGLSHCVVDTKGERVACVADGSVSVLSTQ